MTAKVYILLILTLGALILWPQHNYQDYLSQGDHGRDLYASQAAARGEAPYQDYWWVYGPLMPYYFELSAKIGGFHIISLIVGKLFCVLLTAVFIFLGLSTFLTPLASFFAALWFLLFRPDFFFTYNHQGGILLEVIIACLLLLFLKHHQLRFAWGTLLGVLILGLIKINFALTALLIVSLAVFFHDYLFKVKFNSIKKSFYALAWAGIPLILITIYSACFKGLSWMEIRQCQPYLGDDQPYNTTLWITLQILLNTTWGTIRSSWMNMAIAIIFNGSLIYCLTLWRAKRIPTTQLTSLLLITSLFTLWYVLNLHEFLKSGVWYRSYWAQPFSLMLIFIIIDTATRMSPVFWRKLVFISLGIIALLSGIANEQKLAASKTSQHELIMNGKTVYLGNHPLWIDTVKQTTAFLNKTLKGQELFFALPYDCLYYYLTGKKTPTRQLIFFEHIKIPREQEERIIKELEEAKINYVLVSNRAFARVETGLGILGQHYCPLIADYINKNFTPIARFGDWTNEPGWAWNHGTLILKRK